MDSILVVCYSYTGVSRRAAELLASHEGWPLAIVEDDEPRAGVSGTVRCMLDSMFSRQPPIRYAGPPPGDFRTVVLVAPIWAYALAGPMRTFVAQHHAALRRVAVVITMGSAGASNALAEVRRRTGHSPVASLALTSREVEDGTATARLLAFGDEFRPARAVEPKFTPAHA